MTIREYDDFRLMRPTISDLALDERDDDPADESDDDGTTCRYCNGSGEKQAGMDADNERPVTIPCPRCSGTGETWGWLG